jgi:tRNA modification GTPase
MNTVMNDTIVAISTPPGRGGIAIVRLSGPKALDVAEGTFEGGTPLAHAESHRVYRGWIKDNKEPVDEALVTLFKSPHSYTGEDVIEVSCHGGVFVSQRIVELFVKRGARPAEPGEFTQRAFLNGKIDLSQAEAIADLIQAETEISRRVAVYQLEGHLSEKLEAIRQQLIHACSWIELELDFGEEDVQFISSKELESSLHSIRSEIEKLLLTYNRGKVYRSGVRMVIAGRPNVGKSSLLNNLLERDRAIVTHTPGTTRDTIEDILDIEGLLCIITDTAGIRKTKDPIESEGVQRAQKAMETADLVLLVFDWSEALSKDDKLMITLADKLSCQKLMVINKQDLDQKIELHDLERKLPSIQRVVISAKEQTGLSELESTIKQIILNGQMPQEGEAVLTRIRHVNCLENGMERVEHALSSLTEGMSQEFIALDLRGALDCLGEITGHTTTDEILNHIFSQFCIGK